MSSIMGVHTNLMFKRIIYSINEVTKRCNKEKYK